jgi:cytochrome c oxidase cbb3-type subunit 3/ubiquinol-cytochrome c reductase cytochrome c subunit
MNFARTRPTSRAAVVLGAAVALTAIGCRDASGRPGAHTPEVTRPDQVTDLTTLYAQNCAACHGRDGRNGVAIVLNNPTYLAIAGADNIQRITAAGVPNTTMPPFSQSHGGMLTDQQVSALVQGMMQHWGRADALAGHSAPPYASSAQGSAAAGQQAFSAFCASCHGADGNGAKLQDGSAIGSLLDSSYLALISDQGLRSIILAGQTNQGPHNWHSYGPRPMADADITNIVAWITSHRVATPGQPYAGSQSAGTPQADKPDVNGPDTVRP